MSPGPSRVTRNASSAPVPVPNFAGVRVPLRSFENASFACTVNVFGILATQLERPAPVAVLLGGWSRPMAICGTGTLGENPVLVDTRPS